MNVKSMVQAVRIMTCLTGTHQHKHGNTCCPTTIWIARYSTVRKCMMLVISVTFEFLLSLSILRPQFCKALQKKLISTKTWKTPAVRQQEGAMEGATGLRWFPLVSKLLGVAWDRDRDEDKDEDREKFLRFECLHSPRIFR